MTTRRCWSKYIVDITCHPVILAAYLSFSEMTKILLTWIEFPIQKKVSKHLTVIFVFSLCRSCIVFYFKQLLTVSLWSNMTIWFLAFLRNLRSNLVWTFKCVCVCIRMPSVCLVVCIYSYMIVVIKGRNLFLKKKKLVLRHCIPLVKHESDILILEN